MEKPLLAVLCTEFGLLGVVRGFPVEFSSVNTGESNFFGLTSYLITAIGFILSIIIAFGCVCCRNGKGFKEFSNSSGSLSNTRSEGFVNPTSNAELTIFPPAGTNSNQICRFEPLPEIKPHVPNLRPAAFSCGERDISSQDWFSEPHSNFPRSQLKYYEEYGRGWFGRVVEGEAQNITPKEKLTKVIVKILHEDATATDQMYFLHEVKFYKDLNHPNILRLLGRCLETEPFLIILECYPNGDLKTFLSQNLASARALVEQGATLRMCSNITSGLQFMHKNKFIHTDLAARNCLVGPDLTVKIGDYGNSIENFKSDYYCAGSVALPIRWCAPETLKCTDVTIETREVTPPANIWSLGIVLWEICEFCKLPYSELNDDQVIVRVLGDKNYILEKPAMFCPYKDELYHLMKLCWNPPLQRPTASQLQLVLDNLISSGKISGKDYQIDSKRFSQDFERRWQNSKPNHVLKKDNNDSEGDQINCNVIPSKLKNAKVVDSSFVESQLFGSSFMSTENVGQESTRFRLKPKGENHANEMDDENNAEEFDFDVENVGSKTNSSGKSDEERVKADFQLNVETRPPEFLNPDQRLKIFEADVDSWLKGVEINNEEDENFVRKISEAIRDLDAALAMEKTSSSEEESGKSSHRNSPGKKGSKENEGSGVEFKLESNFRPSFVNFSKSFELNSLQNSVQPQSLNVADFEDRFGSRDDNFEESPKENDSFAGGQSRNSSDTDDEIWRKRIERGEISEKVKEKSKSIANLMVLTHFDANDESDYDLEKPFEKNFNWRNSFSRKTGSHAKSSMSNFGSENDLTNAVLTNEFEESLKKLSNEHKERGRFDSLGMILPTFAGRENVWENLLGNPSGDFHGDEDVFLVREPETDGNDYRSVGETEAETKEDIGNFLGEVASEKLQKDGSKPVDVESNTENSNLEKSREDERNRIDGGYNDENSNNRKPESDRFERENNVEKSIVENLSDLKEIISKGNNLNGNNSKCDNKFNSDRNSSKGNSSHSKRENFVEGADDFEKENGNVELDSFYAEKKPENEFFNSEELKNLSENSSPDAKEKVEIFKSPDLLDHSKKSEKSTAVADEANFDISGKNGFPIILETGLTEAKENSEVAENIFGIPVIATKLSESIPEILITDEGNAESEKPEEEEEEEKLRLNDKIVRPFKFILKDNEIDGDDFARFEADNELIRKQMETSNFEKKSAGDSNDNDGGDGEMVILGACEDYTLDFFKGLKTTSEDVCVDKKTFDGETGPIFFEEEKVGRESNGFDAAESGKGSTCEKNPDFRPICSVDVVKRFIESEKIHGEKMADGADGEDSNFVTGLGNDEESDNFKLRTPDDERSSDSGFRDKGSLSESVEDACEGKYNLEDIEAELEDAYGPGTFGNSDSDKERDDSKNSFRFDFGNGKNDDDYEGDTVEGDADFWPVRHGSDYYPEMSEFNPNCSRGWYLHPPDEISVVSGRTVNEDIVNAIRNELRENLPVQARSFEGNFSVEDANNDPMAVRCPSEFSIPLLSPIIEEKDPSSSWETAECESNTISDDSNSGKMRKNGTNLMESVKSIDTNTFVQYLDYMVESEGKDFAGDEEPETGNANENESRPFSDENSDDENFFPDIDVANDCFSFLDRLESDFAARKHVSGSKVNGDDSMFDNVENGSIGEKNSMADVSKVEKGNVDESNGKVGEEGERPKMSKIEGAGFGNETGILKGKEGKEDILENPVENEEGIFSPETSSPDRERSLSEISRSSNGTRTGDALSEITMSSPDLVPDCFSTSGQETIQNNAGKISETETDHPGETATVSNDPKIDSESFLINERNFHSEFADSSESSKRTETEEPEDSVSVSGAEKENDESAELGQKIETNSYEMSTSFMGDDEDNEDGNDDVGKIIHEDSIGKKETEGNGNDVGEEKLKESGDRSGDWDNSDGSVAEEDDEVEEEEEEEEESSSSSGEFIWKDGENVSKLKAVRASDSDLEKIVFNESKANGDTESGGNSLEAEGNPEMISSGKDDENDDEKDDDNDSSTGSSASITDFIPLAWNSQAIPSRSALRNCYEEADRQREKKSVWFKKQKYHCVYEYPREPSDSEDSESIFGRFNYDENRRQNAKDNHFGFARGQTVDVSSKEFPYGISNVIDYSNYGDWEGETNGDEKESENSMDGRRGSREKNGEKFNFYNLNMFDCDFNNAGANGSEFFVSSSSRPFQGGSTSQVLAETNRIDSIAVGDFGDFIGFEHEGGKEKDRAKGGPEDLRDFSTPDSGLEDSRNVSPLEKKGNRNPEEIVLEMEALASSKEGVADLLDSLKLNFSPETAEDEEEEIRKRVDPCEKGHSSSPKRLGELRHARDKLKLDLPFNHNAELGAMINKKKINRIH